MSRESPPCVLENLNRRPLPRRLPERPQDHAYPTRRNAFGWFLAAVLLVWSLGGVSAQEPPQEPPQQGAEAGAPEDDGAPEETGSQQTGLQEGESEGISPEEAEPPETEPPETEAPETAPQAAAPPPLPAQSAIAQRPATPPADLATLVDADFTRHLPWRFLGPSDGSSDGEGLDFVHLAVDPRPPWRLYAARPDGVPLRLTPGAQSPFGSASAERFVTVPPAHRLIPDPRRDVIYATAGQGTLLRFDEGSGQLRVVSVWPRPEGFGTGPVARYRFARHFPVFFSAHDPDALFAAGNLLFTSTDGGQSWAAVSPDLTRASRSGGDGTLVTAMESRVEAGVFWTGSSDGLVHVSRNFAASWQNVTPPTLPADARITALEAHPRAPGYLYLAAVAPGADAQPWVFRTQDYGGSWTRIIRGMEGAPMVHALAADDQRAGLLFAATNGGLFFSLDDGRRWHPWPQPQDGTAPAILDLELHGDALLAAVEGQGLWILDELGPLRQLNPEVVTDTFHLFTPRRAILRGADDPNRAAAGPDPGPAEGLALFYHLAELPPGTPLRLEILGPGGETIRTFSTGSEPATPHASAPPTEPGLNRFDWDLRYPPADGLAAVQGMNLWSGGPRVLPGPYLVRLAVGGNSTTAQFRVAQDPRSLASPEALTARRDLLLRLRDQLSRIATLRVEIRELARILAAAPPVDTAALGAEAASLAARTRDLRQRLEGLDLLLGPAALVGPEAQRSGGLLEQLSTLAALVELSLDRPTDQQAAVLDELMAEIDAAESGLRRAQQEELPALNQERQGLGLAQLLPAATVQPAEAAQPTSSDGPPAAPEIDEADEEPIESNTLIENEDVVDDSTPEPPTETEQDPTP
ncbi:MAG: hypothetical protein SX243_08755 [Acidobacteriota bacterium]|nr:hypothetical protein [Acidobacteriota bacterium]